MSSKEQIEGTSLESQQLACREFAQSKNIEIAKVFVEQGESAKFADRTQLLELLDFCKKRKGSVEVLLVWKVDRFARNVADHFSVKAALAKCGVRIMSVTEPIDAKPEGKLMETILAGFAQFDNDIRAMRTVQGMRRKLRDGIHPWQPPLGYKSATAVREKKNIPDLPDEPAFSILKRAFSEFATGAYTQMQMNRLMNLWGLVTARGRSLASQSLFGLFTNKFYAGVLVDPWSGEEFPGKHPALVTLEEFARVQQVINRRRNATAHQKHREEFPLRGLVRCPACSHEFTGCFSKGRTETYPYYSCRFKTCVKFGKSIRAAAAHAEFMAFLADITPRPVLIAAIRDSVVSIAKQDSDLRLAARKKSRKRIAQLDSEVDELVHMRAQGLITTDEFLRQKQRLADQRYAWESQAGSVTDADRVERDLDEIMRPLSELRATWTALEPDVRARFNRLVLPGGFLFGRIRTADRGLLFSTFRTFLTSNEGGVASTFTRSNQLFEEIAEFVRVLKRQDEPTGFEESFSTCGSNLSA